MPFAFSRGGRRTALLAVALSSTPAAAWQLATNASSPADAPPPVEPTAAVPPSIAVPPPAGGTLDPSSPLAPMPDLGVAWPDLQAAEPAPPINPPVPGAPTKAAAAPAPKATVDADAARRYHYVIEGLDALQDVSAASLRSRFSQLSTLKAGAGKPANVAQVDRRAREDETILDDLLRAHGYYDANVSTRVENRQDDITVTLSAEPGALYRFTQIDLIGLAAAGDKQAALRKAFPIHAEDPVDAEKVTAAEASLKAQLGRESFAFAKVGEAEVVVDHATHTATLRLVVTPEGAKRFGAIKISGRPIFSAKHLGRIARFHPGDPYDSQRIDDFRRALIQTSLVSSVQITPTPGTRPDTVDIVVKLERAPPRTIAGEIGYGTGEGARIELSWANRNLVKPEGAVTFTGVLGTQEQSLSAQLRRNNFKDRDQVLTLQAAASHTNLAAYDARTISLAATLERQTNIIWQKKWTWSAGPELAISDERDIDASTGLPRRRTYYIAALPGTLAYDGSDDLLNPMRGFRLSGRLSPEVSFRGKAFGYVRTQVDASVYLPLSKRFTIASRVRVGSIIGANRDEIAPSRRFYAGGGGSVRGYGYQDIGPRDGNNDPIGGQSLAEFSIEGRIRFGNFGIVPFFDGGNVYNQTVPQFTGLRYGAGLGARYYTSFGPIRIDLGTPVNPRKGDAPIAVYVSLGQAF